MLIGITGVIGSGKSIVTKVIDSLGYKTFDCDKIVLKAYEDEFIQKQLIKTFNTSSKEEIKKIINDENLNKLNMIIHPYVINYIKDIKTNYDNQFVFIETPLLFELNLDKYFDKVITVYVDENIRNERLKNRSQSDYLRMKKLENNQLNQNEKIKRADYLINNNSSIDNVCKQIENVVDLLKKLT